MIAAIVAIILGIIVIQMSVGLRFDVALRILWPSKVKAYRKLRTERVNAGRFFNVTGACDHVLEMSGLELCRRLNAVGEYVQCSKCLRWVKVASIKDGRVMSEQEKEQQMKDYLVWKEEMASLADLPVGFAGMG